MTLSIRDSIQRSISRSNRNITLLSILAILIGAGAFIGAGGKTYNLPDSDLSFIPTSAYIFRHFGEVQVLTQAQVIALTADQVPLYNVEVEGTALQDSGYTEYSTKNNVKTTTDAYFGYLVLGANESDFKVLVTRHPSVIDEKIVKYKGSIVKPVSISKEVMEDILKDDPTSKDVMLPFVLDTAEDAIPWYMGLAAEAVLVLGGLAGLATVMGRRNPEKHPIMKRLGRFGDTESTMSQIDSEMMSGDVTTVDKLQFTRSWIIFKSGNDMYFARIADVVWAYQHVTQTRYGKNYAAYIWDRSGAMLNVPAKEKKVNEMLTAVLQRAPWAIAGYNKDVEKSWKNDRTGFIRTVDDRLKQMNTRQ